MAFPYNLLRPDTIYELNKELDEISGIVSGKKNRLFCVHDESKDIYELRNGKIVNHFKSGKSGDTEALAIVKNTAYILDAKKCAIYEYIHFVKSMKKPKKHKLNLQKKFDPEGMCYDQANECLLIACKGNPKKSSTVRQVYRFDLERQKFDEKPYFTIDAKTLLGKKTRKTFNPSALAIHPRTREIYLTSSQSLKMIVRLNPRGDTIISKNELPDTMFRQPEGITFSAAGDLYISSEKKNGMCAKIFQFNEL